LLPSFDYLLPTSPQISEIPELVPAVPEPVPEPARPAKRIRFADLILKMYPITRSQLREPGASDHKPQPELEPSRPALPAERTAPLLFLPPGQHQDPPPSVEVNGVEEWEAEEVLDFRWNRKGRGGRPNFKCIVKWIKHNESTELPAAWQNNAQDIINNYHLRYPNKPGFVFQE
jgi:hypothetical protein